MSRQSAGGLLPLAESAAASDATMHERLADAVVRVVDRDGSPLRNRAVTVQQTRHHLKFGCIGFELVPLACGEVHAGGDHDAATRLASLWFALFNTVTLPFYWGAFEPERGQPDTDRLLQAAQWFAARGCAVKGHPLLWHTMTPEWLLLLPEADRLQVQRQRIQREVSDFTGVIDTWDVVNEAVIMPAFTKYDNGPTRMARALGRVPLIRLAFDAARSVNPHATLLLNDFDLSPAYERLIEECLEAGIRIDALGLQSHMHQGYWGEERTLAVLDRFARFGLPLHFTETTLVSGALMPPQIDDLNDHQVEHWPSTPEGEARQADEIVRHFRTLIAHPAVAAVTYWGLSDAGAWLGAPAGLVRADGTTKPAYDALHRLVKGTWWLPPTNLATDDAGRLCVRGFPGDYAVTTPEGMARVSLSTGRSSVVARLDPHG